MNNKIFILRNQEIIELRNIEKLLYKTLIYESNMDIALIVQFL